MSHDQSAPLNLYPMPCRLFPAWHPPIMAAEYQRILSAAKQPRMPGLKYWYCEFWSIQPKLVPLSVMNISKELSNFI